MIGWLNPIALTGLLMVTAPIVVHLLRRQRATHLSFPSLRFVATASTSSIRFRRPADAALLIVRAAIVGFAAIALAQPFAANTRRRVGNDRISRGIVVGSNVSAARQAAEAAEAASQDSDSNIRITASALKDGLADAVRALSGVPASRREIVVISDFRHGALTGADLGAVPPGTGLRFIRVEAPPPTAEFTRDSTLGAPGVPTHVQRIGVSSSGTLVRITPGASRVDGIRIDAAPAMAEILLRSVARAGAPAPDADEPLALTFHSSAKLPDTEGKALAPWMTRTVLRMREQRLLIDAARAQVRRVAPPDLPGIILARNAQDEPVVSSMRRGAELVLLVAAAPDDFLSAVTLQSALAARRGNPDWIEHEVLAIPPATLAQWTRAPGNVELGEHRPPAPGDARWIWGFVLALLLLEIGIRRPRPDQRQSRYADAA